MIKELLLIGGVLASLPVHAQDPYLRTLQGIEFELKMQTLREGTRDLEEESRRKTAIIDRAVGSMVAIEQRRLEREREELRNIQLATETGILTSLGALPKKELETVIRALSPKDARTLKELVNKYSRGRR